MNDLDHDILQAFDAEPLPGRSPEFVARTLEHILRDDRRRLLTKSGIGADVLALPIALLWQGLQNPSAPWAMELFADTLARLSGDPGVMAAAALAAISLVAALVAQQEA